MNRGARHQASGGQIFSEEHKQLVCMPNYMKRNRQALVLFLVLLALERIAILVTKQCDENPFCHY